MDATSTALDLAFAKVELNDIHFDVYVVRDEESIYLAAICLHGSKIDLTVVLDEPTVNHFERLVDRYDPAAEARHERAMERVAAKLLGCGVES